MVLGRKNLRNIMKHVARNPPTAVQMMVRRILLTGSGAALSTVLPLAPAELPTAGLAAALGFSGDADAFVAGGVAFSDVTLAVFFFSPSTFWSASGTVAILEVSTRPSIKRETISTICSNEAHVRASPTYPV